MAAERFNWRLLGGAAFLGLVFAALTITGSLPDPAVTTRLALGLIAIIGIAVGLLASGRPFLHGLAAGLIAGLVAVETQALFIDTYLVNNPQYADIEMPFGWSPRLVTAVLGPVNAILSALISAVVAWIVWKIRTGRERGAR